MPNTLSLQRGSAGKHLAPTMRMKRVEDDVGLHELDPTTFRTNVYSFEHWFESVEGYLHDVRNGHAHLAEEPIEGAERDRLVATLCTYCVGETAALEASSGLVRLAPNQASQIFLATQAADEARHVEVLLGRIAELGVEDPEAEVARRAAPSLRAFKQQLLRLVDSGEWECALYAQNVMLESMEFVVFEEHSRNADRVTRDLLERILRDERRHLGFGENEIARRIRERPEKALEIGTVKQELEALVLDTFEHAARELGLPASESPRLGRAYLAATERLGIHG